MTPHTAQKSTIRRAGTLTAAVAAAALAFSGTAAVSAAPAQAQTDPPVQTQANVDPVATSIATGWQNACAIGTRGSLACWGANLFGQVGIGGGFATEPIPVAVATAGTPLAGKQVAEVAIGSTHVCARTTTNELACWGQNSSGQLGDGTTTNASVPTAVSVARTPLEGKKLARITAGMSHTCVLTTDGIVACWGVNSTGQAGAGSVSTETLVPTALATAGTVLAGKNIAQLEAGGFNTCAVATDDTMACWGEKQVAGGASNSPKPTAVPRAGTPLDGESIVDLSIGRYSACATTSAQATSCWGANGSGQLGDGTTTARSSAGGVATTGTPLEGQQVAATSQFYESTCASTRDGRVACWGDNDNGQLGTGDTTDSTAPLALVVEGTPLQGKDIQTISVGGDFACALADDGSVACWGEGSSGKLGNGTTTAALVPVGAALGKSLPGAPTGLQTRAGANAVLLSWEPPADTGGLPITSYKVTPYRNNVAQPVRIGMSLSMIVGADVGASYTFTVAASNALGDGPASARSDAAVPTGIDPSRTVYSPITPCRIVDTRAGGGAFANREIRDYQVTGSGSRFAAQGGAANGCDIPDDTAAVEATITAVGPATSGFTRAWPSGESMPNATFMNFDTDMDITNTGAIPIAATPTTGPTDNLRLRNFGGAAQYVIDIQGYYVPVAEPDLTSATYTPITPCRIVDTRAGGGAFTNREIRDYQVSGTGNRFAAQGGAANGCDIPDDTAAVEATITAVGPATSGFTRAWPSGESMPNATFMNFDTDMDITNTGAVAIDRTTGAADNLRLRNFGGTTQYVIDIQGYYSPIFVEMSGAEPGVVAAAADSQVRAIYRPITPCRIVDTRIGGGAYANREIRDYQVAGDGNRFAAQGGKADGCGISEDAIAIEGSVTAVGPATSGFTRAWPSGESMPNATFMNFDRGMDITNTGALTIAELELHGLGTGDQLRARNFGGASQYVIDVQGYFVPA